MDLSFIGQEFNTGTLSKRSFAILTKLSITISDVGSYIFRCINPLLGKKSLWIANCLDLGSSSIDIFRKGTYLVPMKTVSSLSR